MENLSQIEEAFKVPESLVPQVIFVDNPLKLFLEENGKQEVSNNHDKFFVEDLKKTLRNFVPIQSVDTFKRTMRRLQENPLTYLFISSKVEEKNYDDLSLLLDKCIDGLVRQRLKNAVLEIVSGLSNLKQLSKTKLPKYIPQNLDEKVFPERFTLLLQLSDPDWLRENTSAILKMNSLGDKVSALRQVFMGAFTESDYLDLNFSSYVEFLLNEIAMIVFTICHLLAHGKTDFSKFNEKRESLEPEFHDALSLISLFGAINFDNENELELHKRKRKRSQKSAEPVEENQNIQIRDKNFSLFYDKYFKVNSLPFFFSPSLFFSSLSIRTFRFFSQVGTSFWNN